MAYTRVKKPYRKTASKKTKSNLKQPKITKYFAKAVKKVITNNEVAHHSHIEDNIVGMTHNNIYTLALTGPILQGTSNSSRLGDAIFLEALKVRTTLTIPQFSGSTGTPVPGIIWRLMVVKSPVRILGTGTSWSGGGLFATDLFIGTPTDMQNAIVDPKVVTCLYDNTFHMPMAPTVNQTANKFLEFTLSLKYRHTYDTGTAYGKKNNLYFLSMAYVDNGISSTPVGSTILTYDLIFKNLE